MKETQLSISQLKKDFIFLKPKLEDRTILAVLVYGSHVKNEQNSRSDYDICIVAPKLKTPKEFAELLRHIWGNVNTNKYDVRIFEELPLYIKASIIKNNEIIYITDKPKLVYYFYITNKIWLDQSVHWINK